MRLAKLVISALLSLMLVACNQSKLTAVDEEGEVYDIKYHAVATSPVTDAEKKLNLEKQLIERLQTTIELLESVNKATLTITSTTETEKTVDAIITTEPNIQLTQEQKNGITNIIISSIPEKVSVNIIESANTK